MNVNVLDIFNDIVSSSISSQSSSNNVWKEKMKFEIGKEYIVRLVPYLKEGREGTASKTLVKYQKYSWQDSSGKWCSVLSPRTWDAKCPISDWSYRVKYKGTDAEREDMNRRLKYKAGAYTNVYVIKDPTNPENEGKVKILDMGKKLYNLITSALNGDLDKSWTEQARKYSGNKNIEIKVGPKVFDLSSDGVNLVIRVNKNQMGLHDYSASEFSISDTDLGKTPDEIQKIYDSCHDVTTLEPVMDFEQITDFFKKSYLDIDNDNRIQTSSPVHTPAVSPINISTPEDAVPSFSAAPVVPSTTSKSVSDSDVDDWFAKNGFDTSKLG